MTYFKRELWRDLNSQDPIRREKAAQEWKQNDQMYMQYFQKIKGKLPRDLVQKLQEYGGFHDFLIREIRFAAEMPARNSCVISFDGMGHQFSLIFCDVTRVSIGLEGFESCICKQLHWGYLEFEIFPDDSIRTSIAFDLENELQIDCKVLQLTDSAGPNSTPQPCSCGKKFLRFLSSFFGT